ncbi:MAG: DMT family transporter [Bdellovibrionales bacterium]
MVNRSGIAAILAACALNLCVGAGFYYARQIDPHFSPLTAILLRIAANLPCLALPLFYGKSLPYLKSWQTSSELWLWAVFGMLTVMTYYESVTILGGARASLMSAGSALVVTAFAPFLAGQARIVTHLICAIGCMLGMALLAQSSAEQSLSVHGLMLALLSGLFSALAYLMVAKGRGRHSSHTVVLHWTFVNLAVAGFLLFLIPVSWPSLRISWVVLIAAGFCAALAQYLTTHSYQKASVSLIACLSICTPLIGMVLDFFAFGLPLTSRSIAGMTIIATCGFIVPLTKST